MLRVLLSNFTSQVGWLLRKIISVKIKNIDETILEIFEGEKTLIRFGDGELQLLLRKGGIGFQKSTPLLEMKLSNLFEEAVTEQKDRILLCMPGILSGVPREYSMKKEAKLYWFEFMARNYKELKKLFERYEGIEFGDSCLTRPFMDTQNFEYAQNVFNAIKENLKERRILIIEGRYTRFGVGNDLLSKAKDVRRILCPEQNAFDKYEDILNYARNQRNIDVVILALGPTAKVLAFNLAILGFWCLDLGHLDVEYEWYRKRATKKEAITNKYVNESGNKILFEEAALDERYKKEVIATIV